jgi:hypothetical protein
VEIKSFFPKDEPNKTGHYKGSSVKTSYLEMVTTTLKTTKFSEQQILSIKIIRILLMRQSGISFNAVSFLRLPSGNIEL